jgi:hypothetical protein
MCKCLQKARVAQAYKLTQEEQGEAMMERTRSLRALR